MGGYNMTRRKDLTGLKSGRLVVLHYAYSEGKRSRAYWQCKCDCGNEKVVVADSLISGRTKSCGCLQKELAADRLLKHGRNRTGKRTREYEVWLHMISRCENENDKSFINYGGRGIKVCDSWRHSFENFLFDMGKRPSTKHSIDRIDVNGNYEPSNCRWVTKDVQARNTRVYRTSKTGIKGVHFDKARNKYRAEIAVNGKRKYLGLFETIEEAAEARKNAEQSFWG